MCPMSRRRCHPESCPNRRHRFSVPNQSNFRKNAYRGFGSWNLRCPPDFATVAQGPPAGVPWASVVGGTGGVAAVFFAWKRAMSALKVSLSSSDPSSGRWPPDTGPDSYLVAADHHGSADFGDDPDGDPGDALPVGGVEQQDRELVAAPTGRMSVLRQFWRKISATRCSTPSPT